jgi:hypothetical protein
MSENLRLARPYLVVLLIFTVGRWGLSLSHAAYEKTNQVFSIVILSEAAALFYAAFCRKWRGYGFARALGLALTLTLAAQILIFLSTVASYALGMETFFNHPTALNVPERVPLGRAIVIRTQGLVANCVLNSIFAALGWVLGGLLPTASPAPEGRIVPS